MKRLLSICFVLLAVAHSAASEELWLKGNIAPQGGVALTNTDGAVWQQEVTLDDSRVFLFSDKYVYFECPDRNYRSANIRINGGTYHVTFNMDTQQWSFEAPTDEYRISAFGSSVCNGQGADGNKGYAWLYGQQLAERYSSGASQHPFYVSGLSIGGNNTRNLLDRYDELTRNYSRYVIIGLSMGNEGIHESSNKEATLSQFSSNMQTLIARIEADGMVPVVMNNYTRGDFTAEDYSYIKRMNMLIHEWDVASVNTLGAIDDGAGHWASGYQQDNAHPTTGGHREFFYAMPPSLFDALAAGKAQPERQMSGSMKLAQGGYLKFRGEGTIHPFTVSVRVKGAQAGRLLTLALTTGTRFGRVDVDAEGHVVYTNPTNRTLTSVGMLDDGQWHTVTLTHYYAQGRTLLYLDGNVVGEQRERLNALADVTVGDVDDSSTQRQWSELFFWRAALSPEEVQGICDGMMLKSSLELYVPALSPLANRAMSMNSINHQGADTPSDPDDTDPDTPQASSGIITSGRARFTVLTPRMIRIQWSTRQNFEDRPTFAVINRQLPVPAYTTREENGYLYIETDELTLRYKVGSTISPLMKSPNNLCITMQLGGRDVLWYPGKEDALNLKGTRRTLDGGSGDNYRNDLEDGIISRSGWAVIDESPKTKRGDGSTTFAFEGQVDGIDWLAEPVDKNAYDWYFMGYGHDYKGAIGDYIQIAGRQPMPPLYALGYWYSKYQRYSQQDFINLTNEMRRNEIPIDVMIMDMDWHLDGWTGWTWNKSLIPNPEGLLNWMHNQGLKVALNLHPADGVGSHEDHFGEISAATGLNENGRVPWKLEEPSFYRAMFQYIIREREQQGVDFWWLDWQQNLTSNYTDGLGETFWCNHVFYNDMRLNRTDRRPLIFHRWGGMGSHRYPIGFSGDTYGTFGSLAFQPYFTATASNVCFGYWGHDLGGHLQLGDPNPELMLRWMQYGAFSPIFRTHGASQWNNERRIWKYDNFPLLLDAVELRYQLMPYIYTAARQAYDTGISICRPLYYEWPEENEAYRREGEYMFGDDILVSPIVTPADADGTTYHQTWLPEGEWFDVCQQKLVGGKQVVSRNYLPEEIPWFIKAGAVIPCNPAVSNLKNRPGEMILMVAPGGEGSTQLYEDDGDTQDYINGAYTMTSLTNTPVADGRQLTIGAAVGSFEGQPSSRVYQVVFLGVGHEPASATINGQPAADWSFDKASGNVTVNVPATSCLQPTTVAISQVSQGVKDVEQSTLNVQRVYDLQGRQANVQRSTLNVHRLQKGVYIINGKKTVLP